MQAFEHYTERKRHIKQALNHQRNRYNLVAWSRLFVLCGAIFLAVMTLWKEWATVGWLATAVATLTFVILVAVHERIAAQRERLLAAERHNDRGLRRLDGTWTTFESDGAQYLVDEHPYALDLDIFGKSSIFQLLNDTHTRAGEKRLAAWLAAPAPFKTISQRQGAAKELGQHHLWREQFAVAGESTQGPTGAMPDPEPLLQWTESADVLANTALIRFAAWFGVALVLSAAVVSSLPGVSVWVFVTAYGVNMAISIALNHRTHPVVDAISDRARDLERYGQMLAHIERADFASDELAEQQKRLAMTGNRASEEIRKLARIVSIVDARRNGAFRALIGPALLWDLHSCLALEKWKRHAGRHARKWLNVIADLEALSCFGTFHFEHPNFVFATVHTNNPQFEAHGLGHPLIDEKKRVVNDVSLTNAGAVLLVTGSNMSGKSTLLRSMGLAAVLSLAGAPACATALRMSYNAVRTSMRVSDSVQEGVSRFYAELLKIKQVTETAQSGATVLFLLDEILHGTNSRERHIGARSIIRTLVQCGSIGAVSTHDLALADLANELEHMQLVHLQEQVIDGNMVFDYLLRPGVVTSGNALRWMRHVGLTVDDEQVAPKHNNETNET